MSWLRSSFRALPRPSSLCSSCARRLYASGPSNPQPPRSSPTASSSRSQPTEAPAVQDEIATPPLEGDPAAPEPQEDAPAAAAPSVRRDLSAFQELTRNAQPMDQMQRDIQQSLGLDNKLYMGSSNRRLTPSQIAQERSASETHHLHVYAHKHNTHITLTRPNRDPIISLSAGNLGFRKSNRGEFDAAYQLASFVFSSIQERGILANIVTLEVIYRGFGVGRDAVTKALLGVEGQKLRHKVNRVTDHTRLKFGGTRSRKPRRLG